MEEKPLKISWIIPNTFCICQCPGKKLQKSRTGKPIMRDLETDLKQFKSQGINTILCLLDKYELRTIGVDEDSYKKICQKLSIHFFQMPILECAAPKQTCKEIYELFDSLNNKVTLCHCRGGIGRAGTLASCLLLKNKITLTTKMAVDAVRNIRDPRCVESQNQYDYISKFQNFLQS